MSKRIALFNHKGGVSKTTTTFNLGWMLAEQGKRVILVDTDPQCNLTGLILGYKSQAELESLYESDKNQNIKDALAPAFESQPTTIKAVNCVQVHGREGLFLLPGHIGFAEYDVTLGIAQELSGSIQTLRNLPGAISHLLDITANKHNADYVLIDMSPSLSATNQNLLMISDYFLVPSSPDYYNVMAIDSLAKILVKWYEWSKKAQKSPTLSEASYPFPTFTPKFLGTVIQNYNLRSGKPTKGFQSLIDQINEVVMGRLIPELRRSGLLLPEERYKQSKLDQDKYCLATISDFNSLITASTRTRTPVFALTIEEIRQTGVVAERSLNSVSNFRKTFADLARRIIGLIENGISNQPIQE